MHIILLGLIILILVFILLFTRTASVSLRTDHVGRTRRSPRPELDIPGEEQRLLSRDEGQDVQQRHTRNYALSRLMAEIDHWKQENVEKTKEIETAHKNIETLQRDLSVSLTQKVKLQHQYETLSRNLEGARLFLSTADIFADSEVAQMLRKLNAELQNTSTFMAESVASIFELGATTPAPGQQIVENSIGPTLAELLRAAGRDNPEVPLYIQIAFQAYLAHHLCWIVSCWSPDKVCNRFIIEIYQRLRERENQAISGRWRSLTRTSGSTLPACEPDFVTPIISGLSDILLIAGCAASQSDIMSELSFMFEKKILSAVLLAGRLNQMIAGVISGDFEVFVVQHGEAYQAESMEEDMDNGGDVVQGAPGATGSGQTVLCTSELGLTKQVQLGTGEKEIKTVIKAKVILESFLYNGD